MSYLRYDRTSHWYVFWQDRSNGTREAERVAIWHISRRADAPTSSYREVRDMLAADDFWAHIRVLRRGL